MARHVVASGAACRLSRCDRDGNDQRRALGLGDVTGSFTVGKRADIVLIRGNDVNVAPVANVETTVVQSATPANVDTVMVDGHIVKRSGRLIGYDVEAIVARAKASALRIRRAAGGVLAPR